jgi:cellulose synthase/poly-beta-1,6-N-acetylglucosamine synthase-like glycosyltransferase
MNSDLLAAAVALVSVVLFAVSASTLWWMLHAWRTPEVLEQTGFAIDNDRPGLSFSLIVPARHEERVLGDTLERLVTLDHPDYEIIAVVGHDDEPTREVAEEVARRWPDRIRVLVDHSWPKNKPKALNTALPACRGAITGVFDAEDEVDRRLLRQVDSCFRRTGATVVQGGVQLINFRSSWYSLHNCLEYFFWFRSRLHLHAERRFIPLGGNTVFIKTDVLRSVGGWDADCLAEDCELGVRLSANGERVEVAYDADLVTREETPGSLSALYRQRTRWNQGFLQVLRKRIWRQLPTRRQRNLARFTLAMPFLQAFAGVVIPLSFLSMFMLRVPVLIALLSFLPLVPTLATLACQMAGLRDFCRLYYVRPRLTDYARLIVGTFPYQLVLAAAAARSVFRELAGVRTWEKTAHSGAHRAAGAPSAQSVEPVVTEVSL